MRKATRTWQPFIASSLLGETRFGGLRGCDIKWRPGLEGIVAFQIAVLTSVDNWEPEWNKLLEQIDDCLNLKSTFIIAANKFRFTAFNASSLREANGSSITARRYILIFTMAAVLYLPPTFTSVS